MPRKFRFSRVLPFAVLALGVLPCVPIDRAAFADGGSFPLPPPDPPPRPLAPPTPRGEPSRPPPLYPPPPPPTPSSPSTPLPGRTPSDPRTPPGTAPATPTTPTQPNLPPPPPVVTPTAPTPTEPDAPAPPVRTPRVRTPGAPTGPRGRSVRSDGGWRDWWEANADALRPLRKGAVITEDPLFRTGASGAGATSGSGALARRLVERDVLPLLRAIVDAPGREDPDIVASAIIALGKLATSPDDVQRLLRVLDDRTAHRQLRRGAAAALGILRRSREADRFDGRLLDAVRSRLVESIDDERDPVEVRCFAAFSLGLLGDQPNNPDDAFARSGRMVVRALWLRLEGEGPRDDDLAVALLLALSMQPVEGVPGAVLDGLRACTVSGRLGGRNVGALTRAHAVLALARLSDGECHGLLLGIAKSHNFDLTLRRSAIIGISLLAPRFDAARRASAVTTLAGISNTGDPDTAGLALLGIARQIAADLAEGSTVIAGRPDALVTLSHAAENAAVDVRPFGAMALALALRPTPRSADLGVATAFRASAFSLLKDGATATSRDPDARGAYVLALGLLSDEHALPLLVDLAKARGSDPGLRADACAALGLLGRATPEALLPLRAALADAVDPRLQREAARALGYLGDASSIPVLLPALQSNGGDSVRCRAALALGAIADPSALPALVILAKNRGVPDGVRSLATSALGIVGEPEPFPSLSRLGVDSNYLARTPAMHEAFGLL